MPSINYNLGIPDPTHNPSNDVSNMQSNNDAISTIWTQDHTGFNTSSSSVPLSGLHKQVTLTTKNTPGAQTDPSSVVYTANGVASSVAQLFFVNQNATYHLSPVRAWASFVGTGALGLIATTQKSNVVSINHNATGSYIITLTANAVSGTTYGVIVSTSQSGTGAQLMADYTISGVSGVFTIVTFSHGPFATADSSNVSFMVLQI